MDYKALGVNIIVSVFQKKEETTEGGIVIAETTVSPFATAKIIGMGEAVRVPVAVNEVVFVEKGGLVPLTSGGVDYFVCREDSLICTIPEGHPKHPEYQKPLIIS